MENSEFRDVIGYEGLYKININGEVFSIRTNRILTLFKRNNKDMVGLSKNGKSTSVSIDTLLHKAFPDLQIKTKNLEDEIWKDIENYESIYQISNCGRIKSLDRYIYQRDAEGNLYERFVPEKVLSLKKNNGNGYIVASLSNGFEQQSSNFYIHILVAKHFIPNIFNKPTVNHIDGNKSNNCVNNLEWATQKEQAQHAIKNNLTTVNTKKLNEEKAVEIYKLVWSNQYTVKEISNIYDISKYTIWAIKNKKAWKTATMNID